MTKQELKVRDLLGLGLEDDLLDAVREVAFKDELTGLPNERAFRRELERRPDAAITVIDLDGFKRVNDDFGHEAGDEILKHVAKRLRKSLRASDFLARLHGDEFVILSDAQDAPALARRLKAPGLPAVGVCAGTGSTFEAADRRMYDMKRDRRRCPSTSKASRARRSRAARTSISA
jgi:predicted signal transduction protein with EAL and GGDEF domain